MQGKRQNAIKRLAARQTLRTSVQANRAMQNAGQAVQNSAEPSEETPTNYAESTAKTAMQDAAATAGNVTMETARLSYAKFKAMQAKRQQNTAALENAAAESAVEPVEASKEAAKPAPAMPSDRRKAVQRKQFQEQAVTAKKSAAKDTMPSIIPESERRAVTQQILKKRHITAQAVRQKLAEKENLPQLESGLIGLLSYLAVCPNTISTVVEGLKDPVVVNGLGAGVIGAQGLFVSMIMSMVAVKFFGLLTLLKLKCQIRFQQELLVHLIF